VKIHPAMLSLLIASIGCSAEYPSCPVETTEDGTQTEQGPEPSHDPAPGPEDPTTPTWPSGDGLADSEGYQRLGDGQICRCDLSDPLCSREEPTVRTSDAVCNVKEPEDPDCRSGGVADGLCAFRVDGDPDCGEPQTPSICGNLYWCCLSVRCGEKDKPFWYQRDTKNIPICPKRAKQPDTRAGAWAEWQKHLKYVMKDLHGSYGHNCWFQAASCYDEPNDLYCHNYPN
jgi:hypothetical protein